MSRSERMKWVTDGRRRKGVEEGGILRKGLQMRVKESEKNMVTGPSL